MTARALLHIAAGALFALGCGFIAWSLAIGAFSIVYEILRAQAAEAALDNKSVLEQVRLIAWLGGIAGGALLFWRWHRNNAPVSGLLKPLILAALIATGATHLGYLVMNGASVEAMISTAFVSLLAGSALAALTHGSLRPLGAFLGRFAVAGLGGFALLWAALAFDKGMSAPYDALGKERILWVKVANPDGRSRPEYREIKAMLRTPTQNVACFAIAWETEHDRAVLPIRCDFTELNAERELILELPGEAPLALKLPFARNPRPMQDYSSWIGIGNGRSFRYRVT